MNLVTMMAMSVKKGARYIAPAADLLHRLQHIMCHNGTLLKETHKNNLFFLEK